MGLSGILRCWDQCRTTENYEPLIAAIKSAIQTTNTITEISLTDDIKSLNSLIAATFCDGYPITLQKAILDLFYFIGSNTFVRYQLLNLTSILKPLIYGLVSKFSDTDQEKLLRTLQLYTIDLHHLTKTVEKEMFAFALKNVIRIIRQPSRDELLEPALGILANLSHFSTLVQQSLIKKDDFEALRKCLLHIMSSEQVSRASLVFSMAVRFYLWKSADKFFDGLNTQKTIQVLLNVLLNGEITMSGLCAGELLADMCLEPLIFSSIISFPGLKLRIKEMVTQLKTKDASLLIKLLHILTRIVENASDSGIDTYIRNLVFERNPDPKASVKDFDCESHEVLCHLFTSISGPEDLVASAILNFLQILLKSPSCDEEKENTIQSNFPKDFLFRSTVDCLQRLAGSANFRQLGDNYFNQQAFIRGRLLRIQLLIRLTEQLLQQFQSNSTLESSLASGNSSLISNLSILGEALYKLVSTQYEGNQLLEILSRDASSSKTPLEHNVAWCKVDLESCLVSAAVAVEALGLLDPCAGMLALMVPSNSQEDEVSITHLTEDVPMTDAGDLRSTQNAARLCAQSLQDLLEHPHTIGLFALSLLTTSSRGSTQKPNLGMGYESRVAVIRLLATALQLNNFDGNRLALQLDKLLPMATNTVMDLLVLLSHQRSPQKLQESRKPITSSFLASWFSSPVGSYTSEPTRTMSQQNTLGPHTISRSALDELSRLEKDADKFIGTVAHLPEGVPKHISQVLGVFEYKIRLLQSREDILEKSIQTNMEALASAHRLSEHYRERAALAEAEAGQLRLMQLQSVAHSENLERKVDLDADKLKQLAVLNAELSTKLKQLEQDYDDMKSKNESLQAKIVTLRDQNRAMDATIDNYRTQLDQAKEQIQAQTMQINKFTQITRLINDLTGNPSADLTSPSVMGAQDASPTGPTDAQPINNAAESLTNATSAVARKVSTRNSRR